MIPLLIGLAVVAIGYLLLMWRAKSRHTEMLTARGGANLDSFVKEFEGTSFSRSVLETAYNDLWRLCRLPIRRSDDLEKTLKLAHEDFDDMLEKRCRALGLADVWKSPQASLFPLKTAEDYVRFLSAVTGEQEKSVERK
jgi:hypothetical protein